MLCRDARTRHESRRSVVALNTTFDEAAGVATRHAAVHVGIATQTQHGLVVPVVRHAEALKVRNGPLSVKPQRNGPLEFSGNLEIWDYCRAYKVNRSNDGTRVLGVSYYDPLGRSVDIEADRVVLACYALENARLMLASGINRNGEVGKHLMTHAFGFFMGLTPESSNPFMGPLVASTAIEDFSGELVHEYDPTVLWGAPIISWPGDYQPLEIAQSMPADAPRWNQAKCEDRSAS